MAKVVHVHLTHGIDGTKRRDWYFSSISAVYTVLTAEQVGATKNYFCYMPVCPVMVQYALKGL